jgi:hypothetical protein
MYGAKLGEEEEVEQVDDPAEEPLSPAALELAGPEEELF